MKIRMVNFLSIFIVFLLPQVYSSLSLGDIEWWCNQTPFPQQCKYHMSLLSHNISRVASRKLILSLSRKEFLAMAQQTALQEVNSALQITNSLVSRVVNDAERSAWRNCLFFYNQTGFRLEQSLDATLISTADDIQTWLSAAATNVRSCNDGFFDVNMTSNIYVPLVMSNNVTQLISNCLAVNFAFTQEKEEIKHEALFKKISRIDAGVMESPDCVVAQDGSGKYRTITEALAAAPGQGKRRNSNYVIYVKQGIYKEIVEVQQSNIVLIGDGIDKTVITGNQRIGSGITLYECATFKVRGDGFKAVGITFENTAGVDAGQAVAMASIADRSVFYYCAFKGYQDTLYAQSNRQFYKNCQIYGTVDFIFGNAAAVFQDCTIFLRKPKPGGGLVVTAQDRKGPHENTGITIHRCRVMAAPDLKPFPQFKAYLGRPWADYARTVYLRSTIDDLVDPQGWLQWEGAPPSRYATLYYAEFQNYGAGASTNKRVKWPGYHVIYDLRTAEYYDVNSLINGQDWLPGTGVPFNAGV